MAEFDNEYPPNSNLSKSKKKKEETEVREWNAPEIKGATIRKKNAFEKFKANFIEEDAQSIGGYVFHDILVPALKKLIDDMLSNSIHMALYGSSARRDYRPGGDSIPHVSYGGMFDRGRNRRERDRDRYYRNNNQSFDLDEEPGFTSRGEAEDFLYELNSYLNRYDILPIGSYKDIYNDSAEKSERRYGMELPRMRIRPSDYDYGWMSINTARVYEDRGFYYINMPKAMPID